MEGRKIYAAEEPTNNKFRLYINYQLDALIIIIYSQNIIILYMFRALSAHLQEDTIVYV